MSVSLGDGRWQFGAKVIRESAPVYWGLNEGIWGRRFQTEASMCGGLLTSRAVREERAWELEVRGTSSVTVRTFDLTAARGRRRVTYTNAHSVCGVDKSPKGRKHGNRPAATDWVTCNNPGKRWWWLDPGQQQRRQEVVGLSDQTWGGCKYQKQNQDLRPENGDGSRTGLGTRRTPRTQLSALYTVSHSIQQRRWDRHCFIIPIL